MLRGGKFNIEHALNLYADGYVILPAEFIYEKEKLSLYSGQVSKSHIYLIGTLPVIDLIEMRGGDGRLFVKCKIGGVVEVIEFIPPDGFRLELDEIAPYLVDGDGAVVPFGPEVFSHYLNSIDMMHFEVLYIGQSYGKSGERNAIDRLERHETLQKISLKGVPLGQKLYVLLLEIVPNNRIITLFNGAIGDDGTGDSRIRNGVDKMYGTSEAERISIFEASMIRYFEPVYNKEFKNSFPSTNLKILKECYEKDFSAVVSEICIDELPFKMFSKSVKPQQYHIAKFNLHEESERRVFFGF